MILLLNDDLIDASKMMGHARAQGVPLVQCRSLADAAGTAQSQQFTCCIVDLHLPGLDLDEWMRILSGLSRRPSVIAYGSHVHAERLSRARKAGCDEVMPRSKFFAEIERIVKCARASMDCIT